MVESQTNARGMQPQTDHIRASLEDGLHKLIDEMAQGAGRGLDPVAAIERVHFYLVYHGRAAHDRMIQELVAQMYLKAWPELLRVAPHGQPTVLSDDQQISKPVKVGR